MRVYSTTAGGEVCKQVIEEGYVASRAKLGLTDDELDYLRIMSDPLFGAEKLRGDEVAESSYPAWRKLAALGYVEVAE